MKKMCRRDFLWLAFGIGCAITICLPVEWLVRILAIAVIILGIICCTK
ncbi:unknown [Clostridium sp. CAG:678]|nr:unknown [Clostridium sp. CAG:678]